MPAIAFPISRNSATATAAAISQCRVSTSGVHAAGSEPAFDLVSNLGEAGLGLCLEPGDQHRLGVRGSNEPPPVAKENARTVDANHFTLLREMPDGVIDDRELLAVRAVDANLGGRHEIRDVREQVLDA